MNDKQKNMNTLINTPFENIKPYDYERVITELKARLDVAEKLLELSKNKLIKYADEDEIASGYGCGCFTEPHVFIRDTVDLISDYEASKEYTSQEENNE